jgi:hypothetical protein
LVSGIPEWFTQTENIKRVLEKFLKSSEVGDSHGFFHGNAFTSRLLGDGTFVVAHASPIKIDGTHSIIQVLVSKKKHGGEEEETVKVYQTEPLDLDARHFHGAEGQGVHSLVIAPDGKSVSFQPTGNGSRILHLDF